MEIRAFGTTQVQSGTDQGAVRPRCKVSTLIKEVISLSGPRDPVRPGTYREALIMANNKRTLLTESFYRFCHLDRHLLKQTIIMKCHQVVYYALL
jgi:hypothetical protein